MAQPSPDLEVAERDLLSAIDYSRGDPRCDGNFEPQPRSDGYGPRAAGRPTHIASSKGSMTNSPKGSTRRIFCKPDNSSIASARPKADRWPRACGPVGARSGAVGERAPSRSTPPRPCNCSPCTSPNRRRRGTAPSGRDRPARSGRAGIGAPDCARRVGLTHSVFCRSVITQPGTIVLTRMRCLPRSRANERVMPCTAALAVV